MPGLTKMYHTEVIIDSHTFLIPKSKTPSLISQIKRYEIKESLTPEEVFKDLHNCHSKPGIMIQGLRYRENLTQAKLAKRLKVTQGDLSKMENGKRSVGKVIAKRLAKIFKSDYRIFL
jgi:DNA-binding XRE family transcriptional regulator